ncbi:hypothetical protein COL154_012810 [Colletotrichum chrysophilum]|nr:hypothetical protein KNSL1_011162 [Colletotrichum chrysophilum]KAJ0351690.1 hypothetical protein COL154_012810 [Colletotrichum chrysophilum]
MNSLRDAIKYRRKVSEIFYKAGAADEGHENFVWKLEEIHTMLWPLESNMVAFVDDVTEAEDTKWKNAFAPLPVDDTQDSPQSSKPNNSESSHNAITIPIPDAIPAPSLPDTAPQQPVRFELENDRTTKCELVAEFLFEMNKVHKQLKEIWEQAAKGEAPIALAAWFTNLVAYEICDRGHIPHDFDLFCSMHNFSAHSYQSVIRGIIRRLDDDQDPDECLKSASRMFMTACVMAEYAKEIRDFDAPEIQGSLRVLTECPFKYTIDCTKTSETASWWSEARKQQIHSVLEAVKTALPTSGPGSRAIVPVESCRTSDCEGNQICEAFFDLTLRFFLQKQRPRVPQWDQVIIMDLFILTEDAASTPSARSSSLQYRTAALQFAMDVHECINEFRNPNSPFAKQYPIVLTCADGFCNAIKQYFEEYKSGPYHESPWTMGCHVVELLMLATSLGLFLCRQYGVLYSILHLYNALRRLNVKGLQIPENRELNKLTQMFSLEIFKGDPPCRGFLHAFRYIVYKSHKYSASTSEASNLEKGLLRGHFRAGDPFLSLVTQHKDLHRRNPVFLTRVYKNPVPIAYDCGDENCAQHKSKAWEYKIEKVRREYEKTTLSEYTAKARDAAAAELSEDSPSSRLNFLKLFQAYSQMLDEFAKRVKGRLKVEYTKQRLWTSDMEYGLELSRFAVEETLEQIDLNFNGTRREQVHLKGHPLLQSAVKMFKDMKEGRKPEDAELTRFLWDLA